MNTLNVTLSQVNADKVASVANASVAQPSSFGAQAQKSEVRSVNAGELQLIGGGNGHGSTV
jgi:hypothetical protein